MSRHGGDQPVWRRDGRALFFVDPQGKLRSMPVSPAGDGGLAFGLPIEPKVPAIGAGHWGTQYDLSPDGRRLYFLHRGDDRPPNEIGVVMGWHALVR